MYELIDSGVYDRSDDFTVVIQPVFEDLLFDIQVESRKSNITFISIIIIYTLMNRESTCNNYIYVEAGDCNDSIFFLYMQDRHLFSLDCLHFSAKGNAFAATALWNNMVI